MKKLILLVAVLAMASGCVYRPYGDRYRGSYGGYGYGGYYGDRYNGNYDRTYRYDRDYRGRDTYRDRRGDNDRDDDDR